jgi:beta-N-acetylhexosaminidase
MTLREKVGQLFCVRPEAFDVALEWDTYTKIATYQLQAVNEQMVKVNAEYPAGGIILFAHNIKDEPQLAAFMEDLRAFNGDPLFYIDEEGGRVARIGNNENFQVEKFPAMGEIGRSGDTKNALRAGKVIGGYLRHYGFDVDLAPVADVNTNPKNPVIGARAFSDDPKVAADMVTAFLKGLDEAGVAGCVKHFPGHGDTQTDSHYGYAQTTKTWEEMLSCEMVTFKAAIKAGVPMIMTAHIGTPGVSGDELPATVNPVILTDKLRNELGYKGVIITDGMAMGAITRQYNSAEAAILSLQAGADIILGPKDFIEAFDAVLAAVENGTLSEERIDESVRRVLTLKASLRK